MNEGMDRQAWGNQLRQRGNSQSGIYLKVLVDNTEFQQSFDCECLQLPLLSLLLICIMWIYCSLTYITTCSINPCSCSQLFPHGQQAPTNHFLPNCVWTMSTCLFFLENYLNLWVVKSLADLTNQLLVSSVFVPLAL